MRSNKRGFTLIELLIAIAIITILSTLVFATVNKARERSRDAQRVSDIRQINNAIQLYITTNGHPPDLGNPSCIDVNIYDASCFASSGQGLANWNTLATQLQPFLRILPGDPCPTCTATNPFITKVYAAGTAPEYVYQTAAAVNAYLLSQGIDPMQAGVTNQPYSVYANKLESKSESFGFGLSVPKTDEGTIVVDEVCPYKENDTLCSLWEQCNKGEEKACGELEDYSNTCPYKNEDTCKVWEQCNSGDKESCDQLDKENNSL